jgi:hypothetical protein
LDFIAIRFEADRLLDGSLTSASEMAGSPLSGPEISTKAATVSLLMEPILFCHSWMVRG